MIDMFSQHLHDDGKVVRVDSRRVKLLLYLLMRLYLLSRPLSVHHLNLLLRHYLSTALFQDVLLVLH
jgi:hypothetical protein